MQAKDKVVMRHDTVLVFHREPPTLRKSNLLRQPLGGDIIVVDPELDTIKPEMLKAIVKGRAYGFRHIALPPIMGMENVAHSWHALIPVIPDIADSKAVRSV